MSHVKYAILCNNTNVLRGRLLVFILMSLLSFTLLPGQEEGQLLPIDKMYLNSIEDFYENADKVKDEIWEGMQLAPVCLFRDNGPAILYHHPSPPPSFHKVSDSLYIGKQNELQLFGATQMEINGVLTAIVDYGPDSYSNREELFAVLFHELHHVYQRENIKQIKFDDPAVLMVYPENDKNDGLKRYEQETLYKLCFEKDKRQFQQLLNQFYSCRQEREKIIGEFLEYEKSVESMEGPAFYCERNYYNHSSSINNVLKTHYNEKNFFAPLTTPYYGRNSLRQRHLASGMAMCSILDQHFNHWQSDYYAQSLSLYDFFISRFSPYKEEIAIDSTYYHISGFHTGQLHMAHASSFQNFMSQPEVKITLQFNRVPQFRGFDPMHAEAINDSTVLHKTYLQLAGKENDGIFISNQNIVTHFDKKIWFVKEVILFAPEESIAVADERIEIDLAGKKVSWRGMVSARTDDELVFYCE